MHPKYRLKQATIKKVLFPLLLFSFIFLITFSFTQQNSSNNPEEFCRKIVLNNLDAIIKNVNESKQILESSAGVHQKIKKLKTCYHAARKNYKEIEFFIEYYSPFEAKFFINGPLVPKIEMELGNKPFNPQGFQVIEENLFNASKTDFNNLKNEYALLAQKLNSLRQYYSAIVIEPDKIHEALQLQMIRIMCLTLNGYDCTVNKESIRESSFAISGIENILVFL